MPYIISDELKYARTKMFIEISKKNKWRLTPEAFMAAVNGSKRLVNNMLYLARRSGYVKVETVLDGRNVVCWNVKVTGEIPDAPAITVSALTPPKGRKTLKSMSKKTVEKKTKTKKIAKAVKPIKTAEQIKVENLEKMKAVTAKRKTKKTFADELDSDEGLNVTYGVDPAWDSTEGLDIKKLVA
jgi:hypothetical protein